MADGIIMPDWIRLGELKLLRPATLDATLDQQQAMTAGSGSSDYLIQARFDSVLPAQGQKTLLVFLRHFA